MRLSRWTLKGPITDWNKQAESVFGWSNKEVIGQHMSDLIIPERLRMAHDAAYVTSWLPVMAPSCDGVSKSRPSGATVLSSRRSWKYRQ